VQVDARQYVPKGGGKFLPGNPGRPPGATERVPRIVKNWKRLMAEAYAGRLVYNRKSRRYAFIDPVTHEPEVDEEGKPIEVNLLELAVSALYDGLADGKLKNATLKEWMKHADKLDVDAGADGKRKGYAIVIHGYPEDPMHREGTPPVMRTRPYQGTGKELLAAATPAAAHPAPAPAVPARATAARDAEGRPLDGYGDTYDDLSDVGNEDEQPIAPPRSPMTPPNRGRAMTPMKPWGQQ
jgi:hypothetical protein